MTGANLDKDKILRLYDAQVRANPVATPGLTVTLGGEVTRLQGVFNFICHWRFNEKGAAQAVGEHADYFRQRQQSLMWRVYGHDKPENIAACLTEQGFVASPQGALMVLPLDDVVMKPVEHDIQHITTAQGVRDYLTVSHAAFHQDEVGSFDYFSKLLPLNDFALFCGYADGEPAVSRLLQIQPNSCFGLLFGGGVSPEHRGKGFYRATVAARVAFAKTRGLKYLTTEARATSRPILTSLGFIPLTDEVTWILEMDNVLQA